MTQEDDAGHRAAAPVGSPRSTEHRRSPRMRSVAAVDRIKGHLRPNHLVLLVGVATSGVVAMIGMAGVRPLWIGLLGATVTAIATLATRAIEAGAPKSKVRYLWGALSVSITLLIFLYAYNQWWEPQKHDQELFEMLVEGEDVSVWRPVGEPGGERTNVYPPVIGTTTVQVDCHVVLDDGEKWFRLGGHSGWLPSAALRPVRGFAQPDIPRC